MGILNIYKNPLPYEVRLHKPGGEPIGDLSAVMLDPVYESQLGGADSFRFRIYKTINGVTLPYYDDIVGKNLIFIKQENREIGYFEIQETSENQEGEIFYKDVSAMSAEIKLSKRRIYLTEGVFTLQNLLNEIMLKLPTWSLGHVDIQLANRSRYIDVVDQNIYEFMLATIQPSYECIFSFDTINKTISVYSILDYGQDTQIYLSYANLVNNLRLSDLTGEIITKLYLYGDQEESVRDINFGQDYIENYSFFKNTKWMSQGLIDALNAYEAVIAANQTIYNGHLTARAQQEADLILLQASRDGKDGELVTLLSQEGFLIATSQSTSVVRAQIVAKELELAGVNSQILLKQGEINTTNSQIAALVNSLAKGNHFTQAELNELDQFVFEEMFQDSTYSMSDYHDYDQRIAMQTELLAAGQEMLNQLSFPRVRADLDIVDFLQIEAFKNWKGDLNTGDRLYLDINNTPVMLRITGFSHAPSSQGLTITIGDKHSLDDSTFQLLELLQQSINTGATVSFERFKYKDYVNNSKNQILDFLENAFDLSQKKITSSTSQNYLWDDSGLLFRRQSESSFAPEQIKITNNAIALTKDSFNTVSTAIGQMPNGEYGVAAELLAGKVILGNFLQIEAANQLMTMNENGLTIGHSSGLRQILIDSNNGFKIQTRPNTGVGFSDKFDVDLLGNITYTGELRGTHFTNGNITGTSININNKFTVDSLGNMTATNGNFTGGTIAIGTKFSVAADGTMTANGANISGNISLSAGSSIDWNLVNSDPDTTVALNTASSASSTASSASSAANTALTVAQQIVAGTYVGGAFISERRIYSPTIHANELIVQPKDTLNNQAFILKSYFNSTLMEVLKIHGFTDIGPYVSFSSPVGGYAHWGFGSTVFTGSAEFDSATYFHGTLHLTSPSNHNIVAKFG